MDIFTAIWAGIVSYIGKDIYSYFISKNRIRSALINRLSDISKWQLELKLDEYYKSVKNPAQGFPIFLATTYNPVYANLAISNPKYFNTEELRLIVLLENKIHAFYETTRIYNKLVVDMKGTEINSVVLKSIEKSLDQINLDKQIISKVGSQFLKCFKTSRLPLFDFEWKYTRRIREIVRIIDDQ